MYVLNFTWGGSWRDGSVLVKCLSALQLQGPEFDSLAHVKDNPRAGVRVRESRDCLAYSRTLSFLKRGRGLAGEMSQWLRALTALPEVLSSNPSNHMVAYNHL
jgi:hypothetical protein